MDPKQLAILIGGVTPAVLLGLSGLFQKMATNAGVGTGPFLIAVGVVTVVIGAIFTLLEPSIVTPPAGVMYSALFGFAWATATGCVAIALRYYDARISQLVPLYNMNTLVAVVLGLAIFGEWRSVSVARLLTAALLIVIGGVLASKS